MHDIPAPADGFTIQFHPLCRRELHSTFDCKVQVNVVRLRERLMLTLLFDLNID